MASTIGSVKSINRKVQSPGYDKAGNQICIIDRKNTVATLDHHSDAHTYSHICV